MQTCEYRGFRQKHSNKLRAYIWCYQSKSLTNTFHLDVFISWYDFTELAMANLGITVMLKNVSAAHQTLSRWYYTGDQNLLILFCVHNYISSNKFSNTTEMQLQTMTKPRLQPLTRWVFSWYLIYSHIVVA